MEEPRPPSPKQLSRTPSWILLGFALGVLFRWRLPARDPAPLPVEPLPSRPAPLPERPLDEVEAVFATWGGHAVWTHELTEISLWDPLTREFSRHYEVLRSGEEYFFRSIPRLTRPVLAYGVPDEAPLRFTETEARREEWLRARRQETWRAVTDAIPGSPKPAAP